MFNERCLAKEVGATQVHWKNIRSPNTNRAKEKKRRMYNTHKSISNNKIQEKKIINPTSTPPQDQETK